VTNGQTRGERLDGWVEEARGGANGTAATPQTPRGGATEDAPDPEAMLDGE
jgi:hypothetical protein